MRHITRFTPAAALGLLIAGASSQSSAIEIEEVMVTAERKVESLQDVAVSIKAFDAGQLEAFQIDGVGDLEGMVPSLYTSPGPFGNQGLRMTMRGIGSIDIQITQDPAVGIYYDDVYIGRPLGIGTDVLDVERIEVLRGPQGTLYGRNTTGGAVKLVTRKPSTEALSFTQEVSLGDRSYAKSRSAINLPITDELAATVTALWSTKDGFVENTGEGADFGDNESRAIATALRWVPGDRFQLDYAFDYSDVEDVSYAYQPALPPKEDVALTYSDSLLDKFPSSWNHKPSTIESFGHSLTAQISLNDFLTFKSITAYREYEEEIYTDLTGATDRSTAFFNDHRMTEQDQFSQEFQFIGETESWSYTAGLFYFKESAEESAVSTPQFGVPASGIPAAFTRDIVGDVSIKSEAYALYAQATYIPAAFDRKLEITLGGRYSDDDKKADRLEIQTSYFQGAQTGEVVIAGSPSDSYSDFSPSGNIRYIINDDVSTYLKVSTGYKSGGFDSRAASSEDFNKGFDLESLTTYEVGFKSQLFNNRMRLNVAAYFTDFEDVQVTVRPLDNPTTTNVLNAGEEERTGIEIDADVLVSEALSLSFSYAYLDAEIKEIMEGGVNVADDFVSVNAPEHSGNVALTYNFGELLVGDSSLTLNAMYVDSKYLNPRKRPAEAGSYAKSYTRLDAHLRLLEAEVGQGSLQVDLWCMNISDEEYVIGAIGEFTTSDRVVIWGEPRTYGVDFRYKF